MASDQTQAASLFEPFFYPARPDGWRFRAYRILFHHESRGERWFDVGLIIAIMISVLIAILDSVPLWHSRHHAAFNALEWGFTLLFSVEFGARLLAVRRPWRYARSFFGIVDFLSIVPTYLALFVVGAHYLSVLRVLRVLRIFRVLQMVRYQSEATMLISALQRSRRKILLFVSVVVTLATSFGALMYLVEGPENGFTSIPHSIYWAIVTMATVGFGDITPHTALGQFITTLIIIIGYGIIAVPTGIYAAELAQAPAPTTAAEKTSPCPCTRCGEPKHTEQARYCHRCGERLDVTGAN